MPFVIRSFLLAMGSWMQLDWPHWRWPASWVAQRSFGRCWSCLHENSGATVISPARPTPWMHSTRCYLTAEQVRRNANRITRFRESSSSGWSFTEWPLALSRSLGTIVRTQGRDSSLRPSFALFPGEKGRKVYYDSVIIFWWISDFGVVW